MNPAPHFPSAEDFRRAYGPDARLPWYMHARWGGHDFDLYVHEAAFLPGTEETPEDTSIALARTLLPELDRLRDEATAYLLGIVDVQKRPLVGIPQLVCLSCDAGRARVLVEVNWESLPDGLWFVEFALHPTRGRIPIGMGMAVWGLRGTPWPPNRAHWTWSSEEPPGS